MTTTKIDREDVLRIAKSIGKILTYEQSNQILELYPDWQSQDITATWDLIVEDLVYFVIANDL
jgi:hypothetical protein